MPIDDRRTGGPVRHLDAPRRPAKRRRSHSPAFKAEVALEALRGETSVAELSAKYSVHQTLINKWKRTLRKEAPCIFGQHGVKDPTEMYRLIDTLYEQLGDLRAHNEHLMKIIRTYDGDSPGSG
jgi:transposase-like protein